MKQSEIENKIVRAFGVENIGTYFLATFKSFLVLAASFSICFKRRFICIVSTRFSIVWSIVVHCNSDKRAKSIAYTPNFRLNRACSSRLFCMCSGNSISWIWKFFNSESYSLPVHAPKRKEEKNTMKIKNNAISNPNTLCAFKFSCNWFLFVDVFFWNSFWHF